MSKKESKAFYDKYIRSAAFRAGVNPHRKKTREIMRILAARLNIPLGSKREFAQLLGYVPRRATPPSVRQNMRKDGLLEFYRSWEWKRTRYEFLKEQPRPLRCLCCGAGNKLVVDHIKPIRRFWELRFDKTNLQVLCDDCNMGKGSRDETDWRPPAGGESTAQVVELRPHPRWRPKYLPAGS